MKRISRNFVASFALALAFLSASNLRADIDVGDFTIGGSAEIDGLPMGFQGDRTRFEQYRSVPESVVVPQLELMIGRKKQDYYFNFDALNVGRDDQNYRLRAGKYGLLEVEFEWDQIPHIFDNGNARTPYIMRGGTYTLRSRPAADDATTFSNWINDRDNTRPVDLDLLNKVAKISIRYTPSPGWNFNGKYWQQNTEGKRAIAFPFGTGSSSNIAELAEPIDYQTHNIEVGGEYAGSGWTLGLKYNGSIFHNSTSTLIFDNPAAIGPEPCVDYKTINYTTGRGPCRGRVDLYPGNQAHTFALTGTANLPFKTNFLATASYGWRIQDDSFLPYTINGCYTGGACGDGAAVMPTLSRRNLDGDIRPTMVNLTLINNFINNLNLKAFYRFYDLDNRTGTVSTSATVRNDQGSPGSDWTAAQPYQYSKNSAGFQASYNFTRSLTGKFNFSWDRTHRNLPDETLNASEIKIGPTVDIKPLSWLLFRASYQHSWRDNPGYHEDRKMFWLAKRDQDKVSLFADISPWETLSFHAGFDFTNDTYSTTDFGVQRVRNYSPSVGFLYAPLEWLRFFADYNFEIYNWNQDYNTAITSKGTDKYNTFSLGSDVDIIKNLLGFRIQYGFSQALSEIDNKGAGSQNWPGSTNTWQELLTRLEYKLHKNVSMQLGYYFNKYHSKDYGVDIMKLWMGDTDTNSGQIRSVYLGDQFGQPFKGSYTAHVAILGVKLKF